jgi:hypothetical protein
MNTMKKIKNYLFILLFILIFCNSSFASDDVLFLNTISYQNISTKLKFEERKTGSINNDSSMSFDEYFQSYFSIYKVASYFKNDGSEAGEVLKKFFCGINLSAAYNENNTKRAGIEFQGGVGEPKRIFANLILGTSYQKDIVFNRLNGWSDIFGFQVGYVDDIHLYFKSTDFLKSIDDTKKLSSLMSTAFVEGLLGWKNFSPIFIKMSGEYSDIKYSAHYNTGYLLYTMHSLKSIFHVQYNNENYNFSLGYTYYRERFMVDEYNSKEVLVGNTKRVRKGYYGGGMTSSLTNIFINGISIFAELHVLTDVDKSFITISKFGFKLLF